LAAGGKYYSSNQDCNPPIRFCSGAIPFYLKSFTLGLKSFSSVWLEKDRDFPKPAQTARQKRAASEKSAQILLSEAENQYSEP
jgi:hypothetical protein